MADVDINPFGDHDKTDFHPDDIGENIPLNPGGEMGGSTWEPEREQVTSFGGKSERVRLMEEDVERLYQKLSKDTSSLKKDIMTFLKLEMENCIIKVWTTYNRGRIKTVGKRKKMLGKNMLLALGFDISKGKVTAQQAIMLNKLKLKKKCLLRLM